VAGSTVNHRLQEENQPRHIPGCLAPRQTKQLLCSLWGQYSALTRPATKTCGLSFTAADLSKTFKRVNPHKAPGPDGIPSRIFRAYADQLAGVFTDIFNQSVSQSAVPTWSAQRITRGKLPALQDTYTTRCHRKAIEIIKDNNHPSHCLFTPLLSRRRGQYRCIKAGTERLKNSFYLKAITLLKCKCNVKQPSLAAANILTQIQPL
jgi:hypothetical protein